MQVINQLAIIVLASVLLGSFVATSIQLNAYAASLGKAFIISEIIKLKAHKKNPTQIPIVTGEFRNDLKDFLASVKP